MCFDANGNLLAVSAPPCPSPTYVYDAENRLVNYSSAAHTYDGNSLRVKKTVSGATTVYIFSGAKVIAEYASGAAPSSPSKEYIYAGSQLLATLTGSTANYHIADHLSPRVTTDSTGTVVGQQAHFPFGEDWYASNSTTKFKFTSYERDSESGNDYAMMRTSINRLGRFSSADLLAGSIYNPQSLNRFTYALNDAINLSDPWGLDICPPGFICVTSWGDGGGGQGGGGTDPGGLFGGGGAGGPIRRPLLDDPPDIGRGVFPIAPLLPVPPPPPPCDSRHGRPFDPAHHPAIDVSQPGLGSPVYALEGGRVAGVNAGGWKVPSPFDFSKPAPPQSTNYIYITSGGYVDQYFHVTPSPLAPLGATVATGNLIGHTDATGRQIGSPGYHVHLQVRDPGGNLIDPRTHLPDCI
jgi:RHS repeat-associated protein